MRTNNFEVLPTTKSLWHTLLKSCNDNCKSLVQELIEKSDRLQLEMQNPEVLRSAAECMMVFPGISVIGEEGDNTILGMVWDEAVKTVNNLVAQFVTVDRFLGMHTEAIKTILETGVEVDTAFEDTLLGISSPKSHPPPITIHLPERASALPIALARKKKCIWSKLRLPRRACMARLASKSVVRHYR
jgi:hypothetical protein